MNVNTKSQKGAANLYSKGQKVDSPNFTGRVWVNLLVGPDHGVNCTMGSVTFEPGARTNWHCHPGGQILIVTEGTGYTQEKGGPKRTIRKGDVIVCAPNVVHWHGASADNVMTHLATGPDADKGRAVWLREVTDEEYNEQK